MLELVINVSISEEDIDEYRVGDPNSVDYPPPLAGRWVGEQIKNGILYQFDHAGVVVTVVSESTKPA